VQGADLEALTDGEQVNCGGSSRLGQLLCYRSHQGSGSVTAQMASTRCDAIWRCTAEESSAHAAIALRRGRLY
jgi:hypothetical protein